MALRVSQRSTAFGSGGPDRPAVVFVANTSWYLYNFRLPLMKRMITEGWRVVAAAPSDEYSKVFADHDIQFEPISCSRGGKNPIQDAWLLYQLFRLYRRQRPAFVHHFTIKPVIYGTVGARLSRVKTVVNSVTGLGYVFLADGATDRITRWFVKGLYRIILRRCSSLVIFQNPDDRDVFSREKLVSPERAVLIRGSGVDVMRFASVPEPAGDVVVILCARMLWDKGVGDLVDAARLLKQWGIPVRVELAGEPDPGNPAAIPQTQLVAWAEEGVVRWLGNQTDIPGVLARSHIAVLPSYREGLPMSLLEAAACGRPLIATDVPGCREVVRHGHNGFLVPVCDSKALADAIRLLVEDRDLRTKMGACSRQIAVSEFSLDRVLRETVDVYRSIVSWSAHRSTSTSQGKTGTPDEPEVARV